MSRNQDVVDALVLAEILTTRLCHDLAGHVSALTSAVEVLRDDPIPDPEALDLANDAGIALVNRLRLARSAWGRVGGPMAVDELRALAEALPHRGVRMALDGVDDSGSFAPAAARLTLNVLLLAAEALPLGGIVEACGQPQQDLVVRIRGPQAAWPAGFASMLTDPAAAVGSLRQTDVVAATRSLQASFTALIAHATGQRVSLLLGPRPEAAPPLLINLAPLH